MPDGVSGSRPPRRRPGLAAAATVLLALLAGAPSLLPGFLHDDHRIIEQNELIRSLSSLPVIFTSGYWTVDENEVPNLYRPLTVLSFAVNHALCGPQPLGYRLVNLGLHAFVALLVLLLAQRLLAARRDGAALFAGLLFAVHPVHTEALGLVVGRSELLAATGVLGSVLLFLRAVGRRDAGDILAGRAFEALSLASFAAAFLSKENGVAAPFVVLAADLLRPFDAGPATGGTGALIAGGRRRVLRGYHVTAALLLAGLLALRASILGGFLVSSFTHYIDNPIAHMPKALGLMTAVKVLGRYALLLLFPLRQTIDWTYNAVPPVASAGDPGFLLGLALFASVLTALAWSWKRRPDLAFALVLVGLSIAPVANLLVPIGTIMAERLLYLPSVGVCLLLAALLPRRTPGRERRGMVARVACLAVLVAGAGRSLIRLYDFRDERTLFAAAIATAPQSARAQFNYGAASETDHDDAAAEQAYRIALAVWPEFADASYNLAGLLARRGDHEAAIVAYRESLRQRPGHVAGLTNLGAALNQAGRAAEALEPLEKAVQIDPQSDRAWTGLGAAFLSLGRAGEAARAYGEAARLAPDRAEYQMNLGLAEEAAGDFQAAARAFGRAAEIRPADAILRYRLGRVLQESGRTTEALAAYNEAVRLAPDSPVPLRSLGMLLYRQGDGDGARRALERAAELDPGRQVMDEEALRLLRTLGSNRHPAR